jgi:cytochrome c peroxidase
MMDPPDQVIVNRIFANFGKALAAYERLVVSRGAPFDRYVAGDTAAISPAAKRGLKLFVGKAACVGCHDTPLFSDNQFHNVGVPQEGEHVPATDTGRFDGVARLLASEFNSDGDYSDDTGTGRLAGLAQSEQDRGKFRTKFLRQVGESGPYMHTGNFATLTEVIQFYNQGGGESGFDGSKDPRVVPLNLSSAEIADLAAFLGSLTGEPVPAALGENTAKP